MPVYSISKLPIKNSERPPTEYIIMEILMQGSRIFFAKKRSRLDITYIWPKVSFSYMINCPQNGMNLPPSSVMTTTVISEVLILQGWQSCISRRKFLWQYFDFTENSFGGNISSSQKKYVTYHLHPS